MPLTITLFKNGTCLLVFLSLSLNFCSFSLNFCSLDLNFCSLVQNFCSLAHNCCSLPHNSCFFLQVTKKVKECPRNKERNDTILFAIKILFLYFVRDKDLFMSRAMSLKSNCLMGWDPSRMCLQLQLYLYTYIYMFQ